MQDYTFLNEYDSELFLKSKNFSMENGNIKLNILSEEKLINHQEALKLIKYFYDDIVEDICKFYQKNNIK